jgi:hypothetical protein
MVIVKTMGKTRVNLFYTKTQILERAIIRPEQSRLAASLFIGSCEPGDKTEDK